MAKINLNSETNNEEWYMCDGADATADYIRTTGSGTFTLQRTYVNGRAIDSKIARIEVDETKWYYIGDGVGTVQQELRLDGEDVEIDRQVVQNAWGEDLGFNPVTTVSDRYGFSQRENDGESSLMHYRARSYDPRIGRFVQKDPIVSRAVHAQYVYADNDPIRKSDPSGERTGLFVDDEAKTAKVVTRIMVSAGKDMGQAFATAQKFSTAINQYWNNNGAGWSVTFTWDSKERKDYTLLFVPDIWYGSEDDEARPELADEFDVVRYNDDYQARTDWWSDKTVGKCERSLKTAPPRSPGGPTHL